MQGSGAYGSAWSDALAGSQVKMPQLWKALHRVERDPRAFRGDERGHRLAGPPHLQMKHLGISLTHAQPIKMYGPLWATQCYHADPTGDHHLIEGTQPAEAHTSRRVSSDRGTQLVRSRWTTDVR